MSLWINTGFFIYIIGKLLALEHIFYVKLQWETVTR